MYISSFVNEKKEAYSGFDSDRYFGTRPLVLG